MLIAVTVTLVAAVVYGGRAGWNALTGGSGSGTSADADSGYLASVSRATFIGTAAVADGLSVHLAGRIPTFVEGTNRGIYVVGADRNALDQLARTAPPAEADVIATTAQSLDDLGRALVRWRDAVSGQRLGLVADAKEAVESAVTRLEADAERWRALQG